MNTSADAADQIVRMSLNSVEVVAKITGAGAKNLATYLYAVLKDQKKTKGKTRLASMLRSGKELKVFAVKNGDLQKFSQEAKRYGILYCALRDKKGSEDGLVDVMVPAEDASKINRIVERFKLATVDTATIKSEIVQTREAASEQSIPQKNEADKLLHELIQGEKKGQPENPVAAKTAKSSQSEPSSESKGKSERGTSDASKRSVREELSEIKAARKQESDMPKREDTVRDSKKTPQKGNQHLQPKKKNKSKKTKERV